MNLGSSGDGATSGDVLALVPPHERRILEAFVRGVPLSRLALVASERPLNEYETAELKRLVQQRSKGFPLQYITGSQGFFGSDFYVNTSVLVPRPETEGLVELALKELPKPTAIGLTGLDLGLGSGCIAITIALERKDSFVYGSEASQEALEVALENARTYRVGNTDFFLSDGPPSLEQYLGLPALDFLVSNPPYLLRSDELATDVRDHEPEEALFCPEGTGLSFYRFLAELFDEKAKDTAFGIFEVSHDRANLVLKLFEDRGYAGSIHNDLTGRPRYVLIRKPLGDVP